MFRVLGFDLGFLFRVFGFDLGFHRLGCEVFPTLKKWWTTGARFGRPRGSNTFKNTGGCESRQT